MDLASTGTPLWPSDHRAALCITIDIDGPYGERNYREAGDSYWLSQTGYEATGLERLLRILADFDLQSTTCWVGRAAEDAQELVRMVADNGHEIAMHTWDHRYLNTMNATDQREDFLRTRETLERITGIVPAGHKSAGWRFDQTTHEIAAELGLDWVIDLPIGDSPVLLPPGSSGHRLVNLSPSWLWSDYHWYVDNVVSPNQVASAWQDDLDTLREDGGLMTITLHPFVSGRPGPARGLARFLEYAVSLGDIWIPTAEQAALWWRERARD